MIEVTYYYSACVGIRTAEASVLCDPWFTEGVYDGSWYHYPPVADGLSMVGRHDFIYVSHIHPDHYDAAFLRSYLERYPQTRVLVPPFEKNFLSKKMTIDGIKHEVTTTLAVGDTTLHLVPNACNELDIDSALVVKRAGHAVVNMNDNLYNAAQLDEVLRLCGGPPHIALMGYTGAGPYPQTYYDDRAVLEEKAEGKKKEFFERYFRMKKHLAPRCTIPFAGKYILGGSLGWMNKYRGISDAVEIARLDPGAVVLADGGKASINTSDLKPTAVRTEPYDNATVEAYVRGLESKPLTAEVYFKDLPPSAMPFGTLLPKAYKHAQARSPIQEDYFFCFKVLDRWFVANAKAGSDQCRFTDDVSALEPRHEIHMDPRHLFGLLTCVFHWNNAEVGSLFRSHRQPDRFNRGAMAFLNFFHV